MTAEQDPLDHAVTDFDFRDDVLAAFKSKTGLTENTVRLISEEKDEPEWMLERRLRAFEIYEELPIEYAVELNRLIELEMDGSLG